MKKLYGGQQPFLTTVASFAGIICCAFTAGAAQEPYDIDLKDLSRPPLQSPKGQQPSHNTKLPVPTTTGAAQESYDIDLKELSRPPLDRSKRQQSLPKAKKPVSITASANGEFSGYTVQSGDHLFLILMRHFGLSNEAAERLIPEIVRLNGMPRAESLSVGQRLLIPLPAATGTAPKTGRLKSSPPTSPEPETAQPVFTETENLVELTLPPSQPCLLARSVAEQLGVLVPAFSELLNESSVSVSHGPLKLAVVCTIKPAEAYTLGRLLALQGVKLLALNSDETPRRVIEGLAGGLGIPLRLANEETTTDELPLTYLFPAAIAGKDLVLTISPETDTN